MSTRGCRQIATAALAAGLIAGLAGCGRLAGGTSPSTPTVHRSASPSAPVRKPASLAGGACLLLDYDVIKTAVGTQFDVAASADKSGTYTCVVQDSQASYPDLTLAITATDLVVSEFRATVVPKGSSPVTKLGKIGYEIQVPAASGVGPTVEVGWLSGNDRLIVMRFTFDAEASLADAATMVAKMIALAKTVDGTTV